MFRRVNLFNIFKEGIMINIILRGIMAVGLLFFIVTMFIYSAFNPITPRMSKRERDKLNRRFYGDS